MRTKNGWVSLIGIFVLCIVFLIMFCMQCKHDNTYIETVSSPTCTDVGVNQIICADCQTVLSMETIPALDHKYGPYVLTQKPNATQNGKEEQHCENCESINVREYVCPHTEILEELVREPSCFEAGLLQNICGECGKVIEEKLINKTDCSWGDWEETKFATPFSNGQRKRMCIICNNTEVSEFSMKMPHKNSIYIPGTGICHRVYVVSLSQSAVDSYDLVYDTSYFGTSGPWVLGHKYGTMSKLPNVTIGQHVYLSIDGNIKTYVVRYSELAKQNEAWTDIIGVNSGVSVLTDLSSETLHMYTCYGTNKNNRWMVLAELI